MSRVVPDVAGIYVALGMHEAARTARAAAAMCEGRRWATRRIVPLNGRPARRRSAARTGRDWRTQPRDERGRWTTNETEAAA